MLHLLTTVMLSIHGSLFVSTLFFKQPCPLVSTRVTRRYGESTPV